MSSIATHSGVGLASVRPPAAHRDRETGRDRGTGRHATYAHADTARVARLWVLGLTAYAVRHRSRQRVQRAAAEQRRGLRGVEGAGGHGPQVLPSTSRFLLSTTDQRCIRILYRFDCGSRRILRGAGVRGEALASGHGVGQVCRRPNAALAGLPEGRAESRHCRASHACQRGRARAHTDTSAAWNGLAHGRSPYVEQGPDAPKLTKVINQLLVDFKPSPEAAAT